MKILKWVGITIFSLVVILFLLARFVFLPQTKSHSPEDIVEYAINDETIVIDYCQPSKKDRVVFGEIVPYGEVWRTGANEATTFNTTKDLTFGSGTLPAGDYTLWTIPNENEWTVIFNTKQYRWGVSSGAKASRDGAFDALQVKAPVETTETVQELFTITVESGDSVGHNLILNWDKTKITVPFE